MNGLLLTHLQAAEQGRGCSMHGGPPACCRATPAPINQPSTNSSWQRIQQCGSSCLPGRRCRACPAHWSGQSSRAATGRQPAGNEGILKQQLAAACTALAGAAATRANNPCTSLHMACRAAPRKRSCNLLALNMRGRRARNFSSVSASGACRCLQMLGQETIRACEAATCRAPKGGTSASHAPQPSSQPHCPPAAAQQRPNAPHHPL